MKPYQIPFILVTLLATACTREAPVTVDSRELESTFPAAYEMVAGIREDGFASLAAQTDLVVPERIEVIQGAPGRRGASVFFDETVCRYRGAADGTSYRFVSCHDRRGALLDLQANEPVFTRGAIKLKLEDGDRSRATQVRAVIQVVI